MGSRPYLRLLVFVAGVCSLGLELATSSLLAPYFGTSRLVWANVIGLTLIYLAAGYVLGGRLADRKPELRVLCATMAAAGLFVAIIPVVSRPILGWSLVRFTTRGGGVLFSSLFGVLALFSVPVILLGMVSPFAIRLDMQDVRAAGSTAGGISALSTIGSILGTFLPTLLLTPLIGTRRTIDLFAVLLLLASLPGVCSSRRGSVGAVTAALVLGSILLFAPAGAIKPLTGEGNQLLYEGESLYNYIQVVSHPSGRGESICLMLNEGRATHSIYTTAFAQSRNPTDLLTNSEWDFFNVAPYFYPRRGKSGVRSLALIGLGAGTLPKQFLAIYGSQARVDGVEIDPQIIKVGRSFFAMEDQDPRYPHYHTYVQDGRVFIALSNRTYDVIAVDTYRWPYIPSHLTTREFFETVRRHLTPDGVAVLNASSGIAGQLGDALASTMKAVFPQVFLLDTPGAANTLIIGVNRSVGDGIENFTANYARMHDPTLRRIMAAALHSEGAGPAVREWKARTNVFTDDWAPIEWIMDRWMVSIELMKLRKWIRHPRQETAERAGGVGPRFASALERKESGRVER